MMRAGKRRRGKGRKRKGERGGGEEKEERRGERMDPVLMTPFQELKTSSSVLSLQVSTTCQQLRGKTYNLWASGRPAALTYSNHRLCFRFMHHHVLYALLCFRSYSRHDLSFQRPVGLLSIPALWTLAGVQNSQLHTGASALAP